MNLARVHVRVIALVVDVVFLMIVLSALVFLLAVFIQFSSPVFCSTRYTLYTPPSVTGCYRIDHCNFAPNSL